MAHAGRVAVRPDGRLPGELRPLRFQLDVSIHAEGSCIVEMGATRVFCTASVDENVPAWRRASGQGWVSAEYRMLPRATNTRSEREGRNDKKGRTAEIERLIGRSLRAAVDLGALGPRVVTVDCDVLQADGGTRCAAINGGFVALALALRRLVDGGALTTLPFRTQVAAVSVGVVAGAPVLDLPYAEDSIADADVNLVLTGGLDIVEIQGTAENAVIPRATLDALLALGEAGITQVLQTQRAALPFELPR